jgi:hypothetical protein
MDDAVDAIGDDTPLRLDEAARVAFPGGGMTAAGLRRESKRGRLVVERIGGKDFTTLDYIKRMRELCRVRPNPRDTGEERNARTKAVELLPPGLSSIEVANRALDATLDALMTPKPREKVRRIRRLGLERKP